MSFSFYVDALIYCTHPCALSMLCFTHFSFCREEDILDIGPVPEEERRSILSSILLQAALPPPQPPSDHTRAGAGAGDEVLKIDPRPLEAEREERELERQVRDSSRGLSRPPGLSHFLTRFSIHTCFQLSRDFSRPMRRIRLPSDPSEWG